MNSEKSIKEVLRLMKAIRLIESGRFPKWSHPYILGFYLRRWPRRYKEGARD